ncbi:LytR/AlgR family response regulator transcription factor [Fibrella aquatilis]|uniref:Response regulator n=1 Tax=Fibrella aquatilis TaxID=2817059 RepID=A0A939K3I8_9BACT|nr:response regulator [Fibrella aquatilis]MBO0934390.1 response regulator [Fibrella aquatilis]
MKNVLIIDDEPKARQLLRAMLTDCAPDLTVVADCDDLPSGVKAIRKLKPDLVFLDIEMPGYSGLELMDFFEESEVDFFVIFTTAYSQYALQAFRFSAIDYLLKPLNINALTDAVERFRQKKDREAQHLSALRFNTESRQTKRIALPQANGIRFIDSNDVLYAKGEGAYTDIFLSSGEKLLISRNLKYLESLVEGIDNLLRCHKSYLINTQYISAYIRQDGGYLKLTNGHDVSVSPDKVASVLAACGGR